MAHCESSDSFSRTICATFETSSDRSAVSFFPSGQPPLDQIYLPMTSRKELLNCACVFGLFTFQRLSLYYAWDFEILGMNITGRDSQSRPCSRYRKMIIHYKHSSETIHTLNNTKLKGVLRDLYPVLRNQKKPKNAHPASQNLKKTLDFLQLPDSSLPVSSAPNTPHPHIYHRLLLLYPISQRRFQLFQTVVAPALNSATRRLSQAATL